MKKLIILLLITIIVSSCDTTTRTKVVITDKYTSLYGGYTTYNIAFKPINSNRIHTKNVSEQDYFNLKKGYIITVNINKYNDKYNN